MISTHEEFLDETIALARASVADGGGPFGAIVVKDGVVIARGQNRVTQHHDPTAHAEIQAIRAACTELGTFSLAGCVVYTSTEPCPMCFGALYWARPDVVYCAATKHDAAAAGFDDAFIYEQIALPFESRSIPFHTIQRPDASAPFTDWTQLETRITY